MVKQQKNLRGFTLAEMLVVTAIVVVLAFVIGNFGRDIFWNNYVMQKALVAEGDAKFAMQKMVVELRTMAPTSDTGAYPLEMASSSTIIFYSDVNRDNTHERVRYFLDGRSLKRGVVTPTGVPISYPTSTEQITTLAGDMVNQLVFSYFNRSYNGTASSTSLSQPVSVQDVRLVKVELLIDANAVQAPAPLYLSSEVMLRNLKDNL